MTLTVGSLFSGIGGLDLGLERAGMSVRWQSEIDPYCCRVLAKHWPDVPNLGDVTKIDWSTVEHVDLICGGYPCQPFSLAGIRRGESDARHLWPHFRDALRSLRPRLALLENVPGHLSLGFGTVQRDLAELGYDTEWDCIPAAAVGAPHLRYRVFVVAHANGQGQPGQPVDAVTRPRIVVPDAGRDELRQQPVTVAGRCGAAVARDDGADGHVADADTGGWDGWTGVVGQGWRGQLTDGGQWATEPDVVLGADGLPTEMDGGRLDADASKGRPDTNLSQLRDAAYAQAVQRSPRGQDRVPPSGVLRSDLHGAGVCQRHRAAQLEASTSTEIPWDILRIVWGYDHAALPSHRRERGQQLAREYPDLMRELSQYPPPPCSACWADGSWESGIPRVATGVPHRVDRLRALGNAVVPQVAEWIGWRIMEAAA